MTDAAIQLTELSLLSVGVAGGNLAKVVEDP